jgi:hypothetical protein
MSPSVGVSIRVLLRSGSTCCVGRGASIKTFACRLGVLVFRSRQVLLVNNVLIFGCRNGFGHIVKLIPRPIGMLSFESPEFFFKRGGGPMLDISAHPFRHYLPFRTMSGNGEPLADLARRFQIGVRKASANRPT